MKRTITALAIILLGVVVFLANTNLFGMQSLLATWWPHGLIAVAGLVLMNNPKQYVWPLFLVAAGVAIQLNNLKVTTINIGDVIFPAIVITFGVSMLVNGRPNRNVSADSSEEVSAFLSGTSTKNNAKDYTGARMTAVMGGIEMDLSHAEIKNEAVLNVFVMMGGIELRVPENVIVKNRASVVLGGIEDKTRPTDSKHNPVLFIDGSILMGGVEVKRGQALLSNRGRGRFHCSPEVHAGITIYPSIWLYPPKAGTLGGAGEPQYSLGSRKVVALRSASVMIHRQLSPWPLAGLLSSMA